MRWIKSGSIFNGGLDITCGSIRRIADGGYLTKDADDIRGSGYVVESLEAALWCFARTDSYEQIKKGHHIELLTPPSLRAIIRPGPESRGPSRRGCRAIRLRRSLVRGRGYGGQA